LTEHDDQAGDLAVGSSIGGYVVEEQIGESPVMQAYRATEPRLARSVIVRIARDDDADWLRDDARRIAGVTHPSIVPVLASGTHGKDGYVVVPDLQVVSLREYAATPNVDSVAATQIVVDLANAVEALSQAGVRVPLNLDTAFVVRAEGRDSGIVDPLLRSGSGDRQLAPADAVASVRELAELLSTLVRAPNTATESAIKQGRAGELTKPSEFAAALTPVLRSLPRRRRRRAEVVALIVAAFAVAVAIAIVVLSQSGDQKRPLPVAASPAPARLVARIPLGLSKNESPTGLAFSPRSAWITTSTGRLVQVDLASNAVVGTPLALDAHHRSLSGVASSAGSLWVSSEAGWLYRVDPATGRVTAKLKLDTYLNPPKVSAGILWVTRSTDDNPSHGQLFRVDTRAVREIGRRIAFDAYPTGLEVRGSSAWILGFRDGAGSVTRIDTSTGRQRSLNVGLWPEDLSLQGQILWITDRDDGTATSLNADTMTFRGRTAHVKGIGGGVDAAVRDVWFTFASSLDAGASFRLARVDPRSGRTAGRSVTLDAAAVGTTGGRVTVTPTGVWVIAKNQLVRLAATSSRSAPAPTVKSPPPYPLEAGPLTAGRWRTHAFAVTTSFSVANLRWIASIPQGDHLNFIPTQGAGREVDIMAPRRVWVSNTELRAIDTAEHLYAQMRSNPRLIIANVRRLQFDRRPAIRFIVKLRRNLASSALCGGPCVPLFPLRTEQIAATASDAGRFTLLTVGKRTIVILESGPRPFTDFAAALLRTLHFA
jgi:hypothetical protein